MTKNEFLAALAAELKKRQIPDADDIVSEYEQHFVFKIEDGFPEGEIAAKLGDPEQIAGQYEPEGPGKDQAGMRWLAVGMFAVLAIPAIMFFWVLIVMGLVLLVAALGFAVLSVCLIGGLNIDSLIPTMPYWIGAVWGLSAAFLAVLLAAGCIYWTAFIFQLARACRRFRQNSMASISGGASLPSLSIYPRFSGKVRRGLRLAVLLSLVLFAVTASLGFIAAALSAGSFQFWHAWDWFVQLVLP
ncbi:MAG TPA: DUF1700 domain-containing protein [Clostridiaceae bacterium]|nr:DUF1700 domain-containing protein [Clostridiaceae bacterium]